MDKKLKILLVFIEPPLPFANAASRWFHVLLKQLDQRGHNVDVMIVSGVAKDIENAKKIFSQRKNFFIFPFDTKKGILRKLKTLLFPHRFIFSSQFYKKLQELDPKKYDIIHIEQTWAGWMGFKYRNKSLMNVHFLKSIDLQYSHRANWKLWILSKSWFLAERYILKQYPFVRTCSERIATQIKLWEPQKPMLASVPFALDLTLYPWIDAKKRQSKKPIITLIGSMTWYPSVSAAERLLNDLWPEIQRRVPNVKLRIVGWSARSALKDYLGMENVEILENVEDIRPYFEEASMMLYAPSRGSGMKMKVMESLAFGIPVVTTSEGAEGLPAVDMMHMGICDDNSGLVQRTVQILEDNELQEKLRIQGRLLLETKCSEQFTVSQIEDLYEKILSSQLYEK